MGPVVRADEDPLVHSELFRRVSEGLMKMCNEICGESENPFSHGDAGQARVVIDSDASLKLYDVDGREVFDSNKGGFTEESGLCGEDQYALMSGMSPEPVRVVPHPDHLQDLINSVVHRVTRRTGERTHGPITHRPQGTAVQKLLRLSEELLECEFVDVDTQWYSKRLAEIKAELNGQEP